MGKLHEILAVEEERKKEAANELNEAQLIFQGKQQFFVQTSVVFEPSAEGEDNKVEGFIDRTYKLNDYINDVTMKKIAPFFDVSYQKEATNSEAKADVVLSSGHVLIKDAPATALLFLERELKKMEEFYKRIPILESGVKFEKSEEEEGVFINESKKVRTKKYIEPIVLYEATKEHPAQVEKISIDKPIGELVTTTKSTKLTRGEKEEMLARVGEVLRAVKKAKTRANNATVKKINIGKDIFDYINKGIKK